LVTNPSQTRLEGGRRLREGARPSPPLASIITVVFRAQHELPPLLESIRPHLGEDAEWIVIDGGSDDGTVAFLAEHDDIIDYWLSEPDRGIYDAMNKGIAAATGHYVLHLNAGDRLRKIPSEQLRQCLTRKVDVAVFTVMMKGWGEYPPRSNLFMRVANAWHHQGTFYRREIHPYYDTHYRILSDFDCNQKMTKSGRVIARFSELVAEQQTLGVSHSVAAADERRGIIRRNFGLSGLIVAVTWDRYCELRVAAKNALSRLRKIIQ
jgi:glycosyltransferase involved in cell wall biosynthesis